MLHMEMNDYKGVVSFSWFTHGTAWCTVSFHPSRSPAVDIADKLRELADAIAPAERSDPQIIDAEVVTPLSLTHQAGE